MISVIVPFSNSKKYIKKSLISIINQTLKKDSYELIAINNNSYDGTISLVNKIFKNQSNCKLLSIKSKIPSPGLARNLGVKKAKYKYVYFIDSDDLLDRNALQILFDKIKNNKNVDLICNNYKIIDLAKNLKKKYRFDLSFFTNNKKKIIDNYLKTSIIPQVVSNLISKKILIKNKITFFKGIHEDIFYFFKILYYSKKIIVVKKKIYKKINNKDSLVNKINNLNVKYCTLGYDNCYNFLKKKNFISKDRLLKLYIYGKIGVISSLISKIKKTKMSLNYKKGLYNLIYETFLKFYISIPRSYKFKTRKDLIIKSFFGKI